MSSGVYQILNKVNGKRYIGSTINLSRRWAEHRRCLRRSEHPNTYLQNAWNLYGGKAFAFAVLECVPDLERLIEREQYYFDALQPEYNIAPVAGSTLGSKRTEEAKRKISEALMGHAVSEHVRRRVGEAHRGRVASLEVRRKMSKSHEGHVPSAETRAKVSKALMGHTVPEETRRRISEANRGMGCHTAKLSDQDVMEIKALLEESALPQKEIAVRYGVTPSAIGNIKQGRTWSHIGDKAVGGDG